MNIGFGKLYGRYGQEIPWGDRARNKRPIQRRLVRSRLNDEFRRFRLEAHEDK